MLQNVLQETPPLKPTVSYDIVLFHNLSCPFFFSFFHHYHPSMYIEGRSKDTMIDMYMICVSTCMFLEGWGWVVASEQGPLETQCSKEQCKTPGSCPDGRSWAPYHFHWGGLGRVLICAVTTRLSWNGLPFTGGFSVCCERQTQTEWEREKINGLAHHGKHVNLLWCSESSRFVLYNCILGAHHYSQIFFPKKNHKSQWEMMLSSYLVKSSVRVCLQCNCIVI